MASHFPSGLKTSEKMILVGLGGILGATGKVAGISRIDLPETASHNRTTPSCPPEASVFPSGLNVRLNTQSACPESLRMGLPLPTSQRSMAGSSPELARIFPSGENAKLRMK